MVEMTVDATAGRRAPEGPRMPASADNPRFHSRHARPAQSGPRTTIRAPPGGC